MLARYKMYRGKRPPTDPLPNGIRQDTRHRTKHVLRPGPEMVDDYLESPDDIAWRRFSRAYRTLLDERFRTDRAPFDRLAELASNEDLHIGCSCPTKANPRVDRCHTFLALEFMKSMYPKLQIEFPRHHD